MSKTRFNRHIGNKKGMALRWRASREKHLGPLPDIATRQRRRAERRKRVWAGMSRENVLCDEHGIIPRRIRRSMAFKRAKMK
jgi:hypothetical protein